MAACASIGAQAFRVPQTCRRIDVIRKALSQIIYGRAKTLEDMLPQVKAWGYEGFELTQRLDTELNLNTTEADCRRLRELSRRTGVTYCSIVAGGAPELALTADDPKVRQARMDEIRKAIQSAQALGVDGLLVVPGRVTPDVPYDVAYERVIDCCKVLAPDAEKAKVAIGIENVWNKLFTSPLDMRDAIDRVGSEYVGCFFDVGNFVFWSFPEQWIRILGPRVKKIHFKDFKFENMQAAFTQLQDGQVDWSAVMAALREVGYDDFAISEVGGSDDVMVETSRRMDHILSL